MGKRKKKLSEFGEFLVVEIYKAGMSKIDFCTAVGINKPYFYENLAGTPPSQEILEKMFEVLDANLPAADKIQPNDLFDKAAKCRQEIPADINDLIRVHPDQWNNIRTVLKEMLPGVK